MKQSNMKHLLLLILSLLNYIIFAQTNYKFPPIEKGDFTVELYQGTARYSTIKEYSTNSKYREFRHNVKTYNKEKRIYPIGIKFEYLITNRIGVGMNVCYNYYSKNDTLLLVESDAQYIKKHRLSVIPTFNYHILQKKHWDIYLTAGFGLRYAHTYDFTVTPYWYYLSNGAKNYYSINGLIGLGVRYYFSEHFGISSNIQLGDEGIVSAGISYKF